MSTHSLDLKLFDNEPNVDFTKEGELKHFKDALNKVRLQPGKTYPLFIDGKPIRTSHTLQSINPNNWDEVIGIVDLAERHHAGDAIAAAKKAFQAWKHVSVVQRASYLVKAAAIIRKRIYEFAAWQILEVGKQWDQAYGDVTEAIDFLEYYAREALRIDKERHLGHKFGEVNLYFYEPKGVSVVIAPWNFPLAISIGMVSAAIVTGNTVVYKPSELSSVIGHLLVEIFQEIGLPNGVFNYLPGYGYAIGDYLVEHPDVSLIAFTGSMQTGLHIIQKAATVHPHQPQVKKVICEMGGKNAMIIDADADLDEAISAVISSAFAFQGQKCSACSRLIVLDEVYDEMVGRLVKAVEGLKMGPAEDPANYLGAVVDLRAQEKNLKYQDLAEQEGKVLFRSGVPQANGFYVPIMIVGDIDPSQRLAQEEVFGPLLCVMRAKDFTQAIEWANSTAYALTGGVFSRSPKNLERAKKELHVGNLYLNRSITGAFVERQPFGGAYMSGTGTKAGGPDYLLQFLNPRVVTENTMRRGFAPGPLE